MLNKAFQFKIILVLLAFSCQFSCFADFYPYISPGIKIGFQIKGGFSVTPKLSFGVYEDNSLVFSNITVGTVFSKYHSVFVEIENGMPLSDFYFITPGVGIGFSIISSSSKFSIKPKGSIFIGSLLAWIRYDITKYGKTFIHDIGIIGTIPLSLYSSLLF